MVPVKYFLSAAAQPPVASEKFVGLLTRLLFPDLRQRRVGDAQQKLKQAPEQREEVEPYCSRLAGADHAVDLHLRQSFRHSLSNGLNCQPRIAVRTPPSGGTSVAHGGMSAATYSITLRGGSDVAVAGTAKALGAAT